MARSPGSFHSIGPKARTLHRFGPCVVCTPLPLPCLPPSGGQDPGEVILIDLLAKGAPADSAWVHHWRDRGQTTLSLARLGAAYWLRAPGIADFLLQMESSEVGIAADSGTDDATLEHLLVDQVLPRLLAHRGHLLVHGSALRINGRGALFIGPSGRGKSTLAGLLQARGHAVLSDDCILLEPDGDGFRALPTYPSLRLYPDSLAALFPDTPDTSSVAAYSEKRRLPTNTPEEPALDMPVDALYLLGDPAQSGDAIRITSLRPAEACEALLRHSFRLDLADRAANAHQFALCGAAARGLPAFRLDYPRDFARAGELVQHISDHLATLPVRD